MQGYAHVVRLVLHRACGRRNGPPLGQLQRGGVVQKLPGVSNPQHGHFTGLCGQGFRDERGVFQAGLLRQPVGLCAGL